ncbi:amino acid adenylation domain-containing protein [Nostoc sp. CHAB 5834]|nr:amino acid adenylation domain-containing protein [Nostoc sp. CHAB 5834]
MIETQLTRDLKKKKLSSCMQLSPLQRGYFVGQRPDFDLHVHPHIYLEFDLKDCDVQSLTVALNKLINRHCMLRAIVLPTAEVSVVQERINYDIIERDLRQLDERKAFEQLVQIRENLYRLNINVDSPPNIEVQITRMNNFTRVHINLDLLFLDGTSVRTVLQELSQMYLHPECILSEKPFDLSSYEAHIHQKYLSERYQRAKKYWSERLKTLPSSPTLPLASYSPVVRRSHLVRRKHILSASQWKVLTKQAQSQQINPTTLLLTAFSLIVAYWSKNQHFLLTMMIQNRDRDFDNLCGVVGNFASTILIEVNFGESLPFAQQAVEIHRQIFRDLAHSMVCGLDILQERNRHEGSAFHAASPVAFVSMLNEHDNKIIPTLFQLENDNMVFSGLETPQVLLDHQAISRPDGGVSLIWDAMDLAFAEGVVDDMFNAYISLVSKFTEDESVWNTSYFDFRSKEEKTQHSEYNEPKTSLSDRCLHEYLYSQAKLLPNKPLLIDSRRTISYGEATYISNRIAWTLRQRCNVKPNELIAVYASKGWEQVIAVQSIIAAGAAYVPIDPAFPENRKLNILERCGCKIVLTSEAHLNDKCISSLEKIAVDLTDNLVTESENLPRFQSSNDLAYVIFTSGSTGESKGVMLNHLGVVNTIDDINHRFNIGSNDVIFGISELSFDLSVYDIFGSIAAGATLIIPPPGANLEPALCARLCAEHNVTVWNSVPALVQLLVEDFEINPRSHKLSFRLFMMSGDWIPIKLPEKIKRLFSAKIVSLGGATEGSIWSIYYDINEVDANWKSIPYGYPLTNQEFYVLDQRMQPRPNNVPGELYIGGVGVAQGYWLDSQKTAQSYVFHPVLKKRIYRTGDWGIRRKIGYIDFLGREDGQVKVRGHRIELGEIESILQQHPSVANAIAKVIGYQTQDAYLAAYIVSKDEATPSLQELHQHVAAFLPEYMVPAKFIFLEQLPLGATGKIDRKALPIPIDIKKAQVSSRFLTQTESTMARLWSEILEIDTPVAENDFFNIGGNSFAAARLTIAINNTFGVEIPVTALLQHPTLEKISKLIDEQYYNNSSNRWSSLISIAGREPSPKTFWFHPSGGGVLCYREMGQLLSPHLHLFGVQAQPVSQQNVVNSIPEMLELYLNEIRAIQPSGPYHLGGWSMGGVIAYVAAQHLIKQGIQVESLVLIDSPAPLRRKIPEFAEIVSWFISDLAEVEQTLKLSCIQQKEPDQDVLFAALQEAQEMGLISFGKMEDLRPIFNVFHSNIHALYNYQASPTKEDVSCLVVMATQNVQERVASESMQIWRSLLPKTTSFREIEGNHYSLLKYPLVSEVTHLILEHLKTKVKVG